MASKDDASHHDSARERVESIPLQQRGPREVEHAASGHDSDADVLSEPAEAYPGQHRRDSLSEYELDKASGSISSVSGRVAAFIMSKAPLLTRSPPALGTSSYGAAPPVHEPTSPSSDEDEESGDIRRRHRGQNSQATLSDSSRRYNRQSMLSTRRRRLSSSWSKLRKTTSNASDIGMGIESKASFAGSGVLPDRGESDSRDDSIRSGSETPPSGTPSVDDEDGSVIENSPYLEVRASVPAVDNTAVSIDTPRMWTLSLLFALTGSATNLFFSLRYPSVAITPVIALVLVHPLGRLWDLMLKRDDDPEETFVNGVRQTATNSLDKGNSSFRAWLGQGRWNEKEHTCVYISSNVSFGFAFATDVIVEQHKFYNQDVPILYQLLLTISTQVLGYAFAGLTRRYLVRPAAMVWPGTLMSTAMFTTMHRHENKPANGWNVSRYRFFVIIWACAFGWYFLPGLLMPALSYFNVVTWFAPKSVVVANLVSSLVPVAARMLTLASLESPLAWGFSR